MTEGTVVATGIVVMTGSVEAVVVVCGADGVVVATVTVDGVALVPGVDATLAGGEGTGTGAGDGAGDGAGVGAGAGGGVGVGGSVLADGTIPVGVVPPEGVDEDVVVWGAVPPPDAVNAAVGTEAGT